MRNRRDFAQQLAQQLAFLSAAALAGCASKPPSVAPTVSYSGGPAPSDEARHDIAMYALSLLDTRYVSGGRGPATGFDCSGLVSHVYNHAARIRVTGSSATMAQIARTIDRSQLQPADLVFFNTLGPPYSHVGVYVGEGKFVHASNPRTGVRMDHLGNRYYAARFEAAKTLLG